MVQRLSRKELYELVWSEPMKDLSGRFGISDVALKKTCERAAIPTPDRGHWAKKEAGKSSFQASLPERPPGMDDDVLVGGGGNYWYHQWTTEEFLAPLPPPPEFHEKIDGVRERISKLIGKLSVPREVRDWHPTIERLLNDDKKRNEKKLAAGYSWDAPLFETPLERRRFRILNTLFIAAARMGGRPFVSRDARSVHLSFYQQHVAITLAPTTEHIQHRGYAATGPNTNLTDTKLSLSILEGVSSEKERISWKDGEGGKLETRIREIVVEVVLTAEIQHRSDALRLYKWRVERKAELEEEERKRKLEAERHERERLKRLEQGHIDRLLRDAAAFQQAGVIRNYVQAIRSAFPSDGPLPTAELETWSSWALAQADRIDPSIGSAFLRSMRDENET
jgi:hypothetical protein